MPTNLPKPPRIPWGDIALVVLGMIGAATLMVAMSRC